MSKWANAIVIHLQFKRSYFYRHKKYRSEALYCNKFVVSASLVAHLWQKSLGIEELCSDCHNALYSILSPIFRNHL